MKGRQQFGPNQFPSNWT